MARVRTIALIVCGFVAVPFAMTAQTPAKGPVAVQFTAKTENVSGAGESIKINLSGWSTDADRDQLVAAWTLTAAPAAGRGGRGAGGRGGGGGRGGRGGRGNAAATPAADDSLPVDPDDPAFRFGRGGRGRGDEATAPETPQSSLSAALKKSPTMGILWTSETVGYSIKYAYRLPQPDGSERIILATDRRVGAWSSLWKPAASVSASDYEFSVIELRVGPKGDGEGKGVVTGKVAVDSAAKTIMLDGYNTLPVVLKGVKKMGS